MTAIRSSLLVLGIVAMATIPPFPTRAYDSHDLLRECANAVRFARTQTVEAADASEVAHCLGFIEGAATGMMQRQKLISILFPDLKQADLDNPVIRERFLDAWAKAGIEVCLPKGIAFTTLAKKLINHVEKHPEQLDLTPFTLVNLAWGAAYPCRLGK